MNLVPESLRQVIVQILTPLIRILLRNGIAYGTFSDIVRKIYVDVGFHEAERLGQKTTISNVSILTGINRKEVKRLKDNPDFDTDRTLKKANRIVRVLAGWQNDPDFLDKDGTPKDLDLEGDSALFTVLVRRYSGDMPVVAMLNALKDGGYATVLDDQSVRLIKRSFAPAIDPEQKLNFLGTDTAELIETIDHNLQVTNPADAWFQRTAFNIKINCDSVPELRESIGKKAESLLEDVDQELSRNEADDNGNRCQVSLGIYLHIKENESKEDSTE